MTVDSMVVVHMDDTPTDPGVGMPRWFSREDVVFFPHSMAQSPACKPSRGTTLTGLYASNHGCRENETGVWDYRELNTVATTARRHGVDFRHWGKYINGYSNGDEVPVNYRPRGYRSIHGNNGGYQDASLIADGQQITTVGYHADVCGEVVTQWAGQTSGPFVFWLSPVAPHEDTNQNESPARYAGVHAATEIARRPSFNTPNGPDWDTQPPWIRNVRPDPFTTEQIAGYDSFHRRQYEALMAIDDLVDTIEAALVANGLAERTAIVVCGDNSYAHMEHRTFAKESFYRECLEIHLSVKWPGVPGRVDNSLVTLTDLAVTSARLGGGHFTYPVDGVDLRPLILDGTPLHEAIFLEGHASLLEKRFYGIAQATPDGTNLGWKYGYYGRADDTDADRHLIDCQNDPYELWNRAGDPAYAAKEAELSALLDTLKPPTAPPLTTYNSGT